MREAYVDTIISFVNKVENIQKRAAEHRKKRVFGMPGDPFLHQVESICEMALPTLKVAEITKKLSRAEEILNCFDEGVWPGDFLKPID